MMTQAICCDTAINRGEITNREIVKQFEDVRIVQISFAPIDGNPGTVEKNVEIKDSICDSMGVMTEYWREIFVYDQIMAILEKM